MHQSQSYSSSIVPTTYCTSTDDEHADSCKWPDTSTMSCLLHASIVMARQLRLPVLRTRTLALKSGRRALSSSRTRGSFDGTSSGSDSDRDEEREKSVLHRSLSSATDRIRSANRHEDIDALVNNFTAPSLAIALRDREKTLSRCAQLFTEGDSEALEELLAPFAKYAGASSIYGPIVEERLHRGEVKTSVKDLVQDLAFDEDILARLKRRLNRMPRQVSKAATRRASVIVPLCHVNGEPSVLFTRRSQYIKRHKGEVCFPGGIVDITDKSIVDTALREMYEEVGIEPENVDVLGILRCDWSEVASITGIAVTPVIGFLGELGDLAPGGLEGLKLNAREVDRAFTVPVKQLMDRENWTIRDYATPAFHGGPYVVWGLTGFFLERFVTEGLVKALKYPSTVREV